VGRLGLGRRDCKREELLAGLRFAHPCGQLQFTAVDVECAGVAGGLAAGLWRSFFIGKPRLRLSNC
jgi:hypothetical protein